MLDLYGEKFSSRFILGTALYPNLDVMLKAIYQSQSQLLTVSLKKSVTNGEYQNQFWHKLSQTKCKFLPNTAGCRNANEAIEIAEVSREIFETNFIKVEVIGDDYNLQPDTIELVKACKELIKRGFYVLPYTTDDLVVAKYLVDVGCKVLMPWAAPIGSGKGLVNPYALKVLRERFSDIKLIVDAGIGVPSEACEVMEMGYDGVLLNSAVALAGDPILMANAFKLAIESGRKAFESKRMIERDLASPSTNLFETPFWHQD